LYDRPLVLDGVAIGERLARRRPGSSVSAPDRNGALAVRHAELVELREGPLPASLALAMSGVVAPADDFLWQTWEWPGGRDAAARILQRCTDAAILNEMTSMMLPVAQRLDVLLGTIVAVVEAHPPLAIHWMRLERFDEPTSFLALAGDAEARVRALFNVRMFNVGHAAPNEMVMDTLGLTLLGLFGDVQVHFRALDPGRVAAYLKNVGTYLASGAMIEDGHTLSAPPPAQETWVCRHEMSVMEPKRGVLDIDPAYPHSARS
jgi:hypothetical protein